MTVELNAYDRSASAAFVGTYKRMTDFTTRKPTTTTTRNAFSTTFGGGSSRTPIPDLCGGNIYLSSYTSTSISSPNYPSNYPPNENCVWHISASRNYRIRITFATFQTEDSCNSCDYLEIYAGSVIGQDFLIARYTQKLYTFRTFHFRYFCLGSMVQNFLMTLQVVQMK